MGKMNQVQVIFIEYFWHFDLFGNRVPPIVGQNFLKVAIFRLIFLKIFFSEKYKKPVVPAIGGSAFGGNFLKIFY